MSAVDLNPKNYTIVLLQLASVVPLFIFRAFVLVCLWKWFAVPLGVVSIGIFHAAGILILARYLTHRLRAPLVGENRVVDKEQQLTDAWLYPSFVLVFGFIASLFV